MWRSLSFFSQINSFIFFFRKHIFRLSLGEILNFYKVLHFKAHRKNWPHVCSPTNQMDVNDVHILVKLEFLLLVKNMRFRQKKIIFTCFMEFGNRHDFSFKFQNFHLHAKNFFIFYHLKSFTHICCEKYRRLLSSFNQSQIEQQQLRTREWFLYTIRFWIRHLFYLHTDTECHSIFYLTLSCTYLLILLNLYVFLAEMYVRESVDDKRAHEHRWSRKKRRVHTQTKNEML